MTYEPFHNLWNGIESIATIIGLLIAGGWAAHTSYLKWQGALQVVIKASQVTLPDDPARYISAIVEIENKGSRNIRLPYDGRDPFTVWPISIDSDGNMVFEKPVRYRVMRASTPNAPTPATTVRAGVVEYIPFFAPVKVPGLYLLTFVVGLSPEEQAVSVGAGKPSGRSASWVGKTYLVVQ